MRGMRGLGSHLYERHEGTGSDEAQHRVNDLHDGRELTHHELRAHRFVRAGLGVCNKNRMWRSLDEFCSARPK